MAEFSGYVLAMRQLATLLVTFSRDERGATAIEYGFIAALMSAATIAIIRQIGLNVSDLTGGVMGGLK
ncbi:MULTISPECIES: Flp family type IVb pilin [Bosea]|uniref:Pilus assembly protein n=1 Tax=Bosea vaviloviae TaxID=1526658 RepID=A0A0N1F691_9HYPH|nr:hypothetical protein AE618_01875 [Bosea vaviloviae]